MIETTKGEAGLEPARNDLADETRPNQQHDVRLEREPETEYDIRLCHLGYLPAKTLHGESRTRTCTMSMPKDEPKPKPKTALVFVPRYQTVDFCQWAARSCVNVLTCIGIDLQQPNTEAARDHRDIRAPVLTQR